MKSTVMIMLSALAFGCFAGVKPTPEKVAHLTSKVAHWQIDTFADHGKYRLRPGDGISKGRARKNWHDLTWHNGVLYVGMDVWRKVSGDPAVKNFLVMIGDRNGWEPYTKSYHADDHVVGQFYLSLYEEHKNPEMLAPFQKHFNWILDNRKTGTLEWVSNSKVAYQRWSWCDALFMAPPVWARLSKITGDRKYLNFMDHEYHATYNLLWDKEEHLFYRDTRFFTKSEKNGRKVFWSRGNGWVFGGLALMIPDLPVDWEGRQFYVDTFRQMAASLKHWQREDGTWSMGLLGATKDYPTIESSGTSFYSFGLAWGINNGLLNPAEYEPVVFKAWQALANCVNEDGMVGYVQPVGAAPGKSFAQYTEVYGVGAFLAAGSEIYKLVGGKVPAFKNFGH